MIYPQRGNHKKIFCFFLVLINLYYLGFADGMVFSSYTTLQRFPAIPQQRAIIVQRASTETLIIESKFTSDSPSSYGWIIPVPEVPNRFDAIKYNFDSLSERSGPLLWFDYPYAYPAYIVAFCMLCNTIFFWAVGGIRPVRLLLCLFGSYFLLIFFIAPFGMYGYRVYGPGGSASMTTGYNPKGVVVEASQTVGNYSVVSLKANQADNLDRWLKENGFSVLPPDARITVEQLIRENWHFVAAKMNVPWTGLIAPHPIVMTFTSDHAIYPMRLTRHAESPVYLELYVVSDRRAACNGLNIEYCCIKEMPKSLNGVIEREWDDDIWDALKNAGVTPWIGCVFTRLAGTLKPDQMKEDLSMTMNSPKPYRLVAYTRYGAYMKAAVWALITWTLGMLVMMGVFSWNIRKDAKSDLSASSNRTSLRWSIYRAWCFVTGLSSLLLVLIYLLLPKYF